MEENFMNAMKRKPTSPGEILREEFLLPLRITQRQLADHLGCDLKVINRIVNEKSQVTPKMAMKLAATFNTTADFCLNAQKALDLYRATLEIKRLPESLIKKAG
jgi:addiction module HigA family antidote